MTRFNQTVFNISNQMKVLKKIHLFLFLLLLSWNVSGQNTQEVVFLQLNDVYEIAPLSNGTVGGMARVATLYKQLKAQNPHTFMVLAGDFLNPSVIGTLKYEGKNIKGKQMVEVMNVMGIDYVTFGNHEFDLEMSELQERLNESTFQWVIANAKYKTANAPISPFFREKNGQKEFFPNHTTIHAGKVKIGLIGLMLAVDKPFVQMENQFDRALEEYNLLKDQTDFTVALTHQSIEEDRELAQKIPQLALIIGGHEHDNMDVKVGNVRICKADANAKTAYIHRFVFDLDTKNLTITSELKKIDNAIPDDPATAKVVDKWLVIADQSIRAIGLNPTQELMEAKEPLDGLESSVRTKHTNLTTLIAKAMLRACPQSLASVYNGGSIRVDDKLEGKITEYDVLRILPFGGQIVEVEMKGSLLKKVLETGRNNQGKGGFLHYDNIKAKKKKWKIGKKKIKEQEYYRIAITDFLMTGQEANLDFLTGQNPEIRQIIRPNINDKNDLRNDIRRAVVEFMRKQK
ncbi:bifunctional metallophosphatase/5'-nucleotidase [Thermoflexibacter ruber]|nr:bifunctional metallophosphatase/5'-nucleotidase [Thermoflexibacter ruber]